MNEYLSIAWQALGIVCAIVTAASSFCAATPTPDPNTVWGKVYVWIERAGLLVAKAKEQHLVPEGK